MPSEGYDVYNRDLSEMVKGCRKRNGPIRWEEVDEIIRQVVKDNPLGEIDDEQAREV